MRRRESHDTDDGMADETEPAMTSAAAYSRGMHAATRSVFTIVIFGTFVGYGALCHDLGFSLVWALTSTVLDRPDPLSSSW